MNECHKLPQNQPLTPVSGASNRPSTRSEFERQQMPETGGTLPPKGDGPIPFQGIATPSAGAAPGKKKMFLVITADKLEKLLRQWIGPEELC